MKHAIYTFCLLFLLSLQSSGSAYPPAPQVSLLGQLVRADAQDSEPLQGPVDLSLRVYAVADQGEPLSEQQFQAVPLDQGRFRLALDLTRVPSRFWKHLYLEVAMRPPGRKYAPFFPLPPRQALNLFADDSRQAHLKLELRWSPPQLFAVQG